MGARHLILAALLAAIPAGAFAEAPADSVLRQLRAQGYAEFAVSRTLLGRLRILATAPDGSSREVVLNPATGEVLRDVLLAESDDAWLWGRAEGEDLTDEQRGEEVVPEEGDDDEDRGSEVEEEDDDPPPPEEDDGGDGSEDDPPPSAED